MDDRDLETEEQLLSRPYQTQLEDISVSKNTIIHLPTGSGKTFIAINLIKRLRNDLRKPWGQGGKRTFFLVNTIPLVMQQKKVIESLCPVESVAGYSGEDGVDYWKKEKWDEELKKHQVIVMTAQILFDMLTHSYIRIEDINLLIFDECHHAVNDHPMRMIMAHFEMCPVDNQPRVLGLTATLLNANVDMCKVPKTLRELETTFHASIATVNEMGEVLNYSTNPNEVIMFYKPPVKTEAASQAIQILDNLQNLVLATKLPQVSGHPDIKLQKWQHDISCDPKKMVKEVRNMIVSMIMFINELGVYGGSLGILAYIILMERLKRKSITAQAENLFKFAITHSIAARMILINSMEKDSGYEKIIKHSSEKFVQVLNVLKEYSPQAINSPKGLLKVNIARKPMSAIIFTKQRFTAKVLYNLLKDVKEANPEEFGFLKHDFIVGFNINPTKCTREQHYTKKASQTALLKFSKKELNCIISTSVIEEGVDITQCLLVLRYDCPEEYRSYIQSKGRARSSESSYVILVEQSNFHKFSKQYEGFQKIESYIQKILVGCSDDREAPTEEEIQDMYDTEDIPPYITSNGNRLAAVSAISLLNRYCMALPHDQFTVITPLWVEEKVRDNTGEQFRVVKIFMPIACPIKDVIEGKPMTNLKSAKRSAALNACIQLHHVGELDPITLLPRHYGEVDFEQPDVRACFPNWPWDEDEDEGLKDIRKTGTKKRVRKHVKVFPSYLQGPKNIDSKTTFYLHIIKMEIMFAEPSDSREKALYNFLKMHEGFGLLTPNALPKLCDFPLFLTVGEVKTSLEVNYAVLPMNSSIFNLIKRFHYFIFDEVLDVAKKFTVFDGTANAMYVVPVKSDDDGFDVDWECLQTSYSIPLLTEPTFDERRKLKVSPEAYMYHVVSPWYRGTICPPRYIVSRVLEYKTPNSEFDSESDMSGTYSEYYSAKYNLEVVGDKNQPLLEVRNITTRMNCLLPRAATLNAFTEKQKRQIALAEEDDKIKAFPEIFIPEFCVKYDFPGVLWYKAMILPCIIHRVTMLLVAHELRAEIARSTKIGQPVLLAGHEWLPIEVDYSSTVKSMLQQIEPQNLNNAVDRINNPIDDSLPRPLNIVSMTESLYQLQLKKISEEYPWDENSEPIDIDRNITTVTVMDIECYDEFMSTPMVISDPTLRSPPRADPPPSTAILPSPIKLVSKIAILSKQPSHRGPELRDIVKALTAINSHDTFNLERVETLGDSFLKFAASLYLYHKFGMLNEGQLTNIKSRLIGNRNLYYAGAKARLGGRMKVEQFSPKKDFLVPAFFAPKEVQKFIEQKKIRPTFLIPIEFPIDEVLNGQISSKSMKPVHERYQEENGTAEVEPIGGAQISMQCYVRAQAVSDKSVADCVEALVGTYLLSDGIKAAVKVLEWFKILPPEDNFTRLLNLRVPTVMTEKKVSADEINRIMNYYCEDIERIMGYKFKDPSYMLEAISHSSYIRNRITRSYERLEFLGDAILDFLITTHIFESSGDLNPGELTNLRSALVNNVTFASYVVKLGLHKYFCYQLNPSLEKAIIAFVEHQERRNHNIIEEVLYLIDEEDCQISEYVEVPKILSDIFESLAGAIFLDSGGDLQTVWSVFYRIMCQEIYTFSRRIPLQPVKVLYEKIHACPVFHKAEVVPNLEVPKVMVPVTITKNGLQHTVHGFGGNKFQAKRAAAKLALKVLAM